MSAGLSFHILGPLEVRRADGSPVDLGGPQPRLVLARLLVADARIVAVDTLLDTLWGEEPPESAGGTLQTYISRLRRALGPDGTTLLRYESSGYRLGVAADQVDARRFEQLADRGHRLLAADDPGAAARSLRDALALWRGEVLADADAEFARTAAARWQERRLTAVEDLYDAELRCGRAVAVVADLSDAVAASPLRERLRGLFALALYRAGRQADALAVLEDGRRLLSDELGLDLSRELRSLQSRILDQDASLDLASTPPAAGPPNVPPTAAPPAHTPQLMGPLIDRATDELIGRRPELQLATATLAEAMRGEGCRSIVIEGEPGIGKTRLAQEVLRQAEAAGATTLSAGTLEIGAAPAYGPWLQLFRAAQQRPDALPESADHLFAGSSQLIAGTAPAVVAAALADSVAETITAVAARHGLVILIEDLQWADPASLDLLIGLGPRLTATPVLFVVTVRDLEVGRDDAVVETLAQLTRQPGTRRLNLRGLSRTESGVLLERISGAPVPAEVVAAVHARSEGNPFFTAELARMITDLGGLDASAIRATLVPTGVRDVVQRRVARLPEATGRIMEVAAVLGRQVDLELLARVAGRPLDDCLDDLEPALLNRLLEVPQSAPGAVRFTHALVREALAEGMSSLRRARLHLKAADGILAAIGENDDTLEIVAEHLWHAAAVGASGRAAVTLEAAAQVALRRQALVSAESLLGRAASLYRAANTDGGLAELRVLRQLGFVGAALHGYAVNADSELVRRARELASATKRPDILLDLIWADWAGCDTGGEPLRGLRLVEEAEALVADLDDDLLTAGVASMRGFTERHFGRMQSAYDHIDLAVRLFDTTRVAQEAGFYLNGFLTSKGFRQWSGTLVRGIDRAALEDLYRAQDLPFGRMVIGLFGASATMAERDAEGVTLWAARMRAADPEGMLSFWAASAELYSALGQLMRGAHEEGLALLETGLEHMKQAQARTTLAGICAAAAQELAELGDLDHARRQLALAHRALADNGEGCYRPYVMAVEAHVVLAEGDAARALELIDEAIALATEHGSLGAVARFERERIALHERQRAS